MTPSQLDHLNRIKTHLENLLANAEKRTPGEWFSDISEYSTAVILEHDLGRPIVTMNPIAVMDKNKGHDAAFIASCAGNAEAGWRSALAAITAAQRYIERSQSIGDHCGIECANGVINSILTAWPIEKLP